MNLFSGDLDRTGERAQVIVALVAPFEPDTLARGQGNFLTICGATAWRPDF